MAVLLLILLLGITALVAWIFSLSARRHSWLMAVIRLGVILLSLVITVPVSKYLGLFLAGFMWNKAGETLLSEATLEFFREVSIAEASLEAIIGLIIAILLFAIIFLVVRMVLSLLAIIPEKIVEVLRKKGPYNRPIAGSIGALNGVLIMLIVMTPLCGLLMTAADASHAFFYETDAPDTSIMQPSAEVEGISPVEVLETVANEMDQGVVRAVATVGMPVYSWLTTTDLATNDILDETVEFSLHKEIVHLAKTIGDVICAADTVGDGFSESDKAVLMSAGDTLLESPWVSELGAETLSYAGSRWSNDREAFGVPAPEINDTMQPTMKVVYHILATENADTIKADLHTILDVLGTMAVNGFFDNGVDEETLLNSLADQSDDGQSLVDRLQAILEDNEHLSPLSAEIDAIISRVVSAVLSTDLRENERYNPVIQQVSGSLNHAMTIEDEEERHEVVRGAVKEAFETENIVIPEDLALEMSDEIMTECGADGEITDDEVREYLANRMEKDDGTIQKILDENDLSAFLKQAQ